MAITGATWISDSRVDITFDAQVDAEIAGHPHSWTITTAAPNSPVTIYAVSIKTGGQGCEVRVGPRVARDTLYTVTATVNEGAGSVSTNTTTPADLLNRPLLEWPNGLFESLTSAISDVFQTLHGRPETLLSERFRHADTRVFVESTLGFPLAGAVRINGNRYTYTGIEPMAFTGVLPDQPHFRAIPKRASVTFDVRSYLPD